MTNQKPKPVKTILISFIAFLVLAFGSNQEVQETIAYYTGLEKDITEYISGGGQVLGENVELATVNRVVDGDTVVLDDGRKIRLLNIDTPETKKPRTPIMCFGPEASKFMEILLTDRKIQLTKDKESADRYGRDLRFIFLEGKNTEDIEQSVNAELVKLGFARTSIYKPNDTYEAEFIQLEQDAQKSKVGAWSSCPEPFEK